MKLRASFLCSLFIAGLGGLRAGELPPPGMAFIAGGSYKPLYAQGAGPRAVGSFFIDTTQVTNAQFLEFVKKHPEWRRSKVARTLADANYLRHWAGDLDLGDDR